MQEKRRLTLTLAAQMLAFAVNLCISFFLSPYLIEQIGREAYGFYGLANNFVSYAQIITIALNSMSGRFITIEFQTGTRRGVNQYVSSVLIANGAIAAVLAVPAAVLIGHLEWFRVPQQLLGDVTVLWALLFANFLIGLVGNVFSVATYVCNRMELSSLRSIEANLLRCAVLLLCYVFFAPRVWYIGISVVACTVYSLGCNLRYTRKLMPEVRVNPRDFDWQKVRMMLASGIWNSISKLGSILTNGLDLLITNLLVGAGSMGLVSISKAIPGYILTLFGQLANVFQPALTIAYANRDAEEIRCQLLRAVRLLGMIACIPVTVLFVLGDSFFALWVPSQDAQLLQLLAIVGCLEYPLVLALEPLWNIFLVVNKTRQSAIAVLVKSAAGLAMTFCLLRLCTTELQKMLVICGVTSLFNILMSVTFLPLYGARCLGLRWTVFYTAMGKNVLSVVLMTGIAWGIKRCLVPDSWRKLIAAGLLTAGIAVVMNFWLLFPCEERRVLLSQLRHKMQKREDKG